MWADIIHDRASRPHRSGVRGLLDTAARAVREHSVQRFQDWRRRRRELAELMRLEDRDLADLGIARGDFRAIVDGTYSREADAFAHAPARPLSFVRDEDIAPVPRPEGTGMPSAPALFWPFFVQPSWYERYWLGDR